MIESITFNTAEGKLVVVYVDGAVREYIDRASYLADHPERVTDCDAMGWA